MSAATRSMTSSSAVAGAPSCPITRAKSGSCRLSEVRMTVRESASACLAAGATKCSSRRPSTRSTASRTAAEAFCDALDSASLR